MPESDGEPQFFAEVPALPGDIPVPQNSNWFSLAALALVALIWFIQNGLPLFKRKKDTVEVTAADDNEDHDLLREIVSELRGVRADLNEVKTSQRETIIMLRVAEEARRR